MKGLAYVGLILGLSASEYIYKLFAHENKQQENQISLQPML